MLLPLDEVPVHVPLRRPRPLRFERLPVPVWNPYSRGRLSPAKSEDRKGGEGKTDANLTHFFKHLLRLAPQLAATPWGGSHLLPLSPQLADPPSQDSPPRPLCQQPCCQTAQKTARYAPRRHPGGFGS